MLSVVYKMFSSILHERLKVYAERILNEYQCGFRLDRAMTNQIFVMRQIAEKFYEHDIDLNVQAFDGINENINIKHEGCLALN